MTVSPARTSPKDTRMYKTAVCWMIRRNIAALNGGRHEPPLTMFAPDAGLSFPGIKGKIRRQQDYEHTERAAAFDAHMDSGGTTRSPR
jgi:hypothetical protein